MIIQKFRGARWVVGAIVFALIALTMASNPMRAQANALIPVATLLNADGTLDTSTGVSGALDVRGWNITLDAERGPLLSPADAPPASPTSGAWSALSTGTNNIVETIAIVGTDLYAGGYFTSVGSCASGCNRIAKWNGSTWSALGTGMGDGAVFALAVRGTDLYAAGSFTNAGSCTSVDGCNRIAKWNGSTWSALGGGMNNTIYALAVIGTDLYAGGTFIYAGTCMSGCARIAKWNGSIWSALGTGISNSSVYALAVSGTDLYVGGSFAGAGNCTSGNGCYKIAKWNGATWSPLGTGVDGAVWTLAVNGTDLYAGGSFLNAGSCTSGNGCNYIAKWNGSTWSPLGAGMNNTVYALAVNNTNIYAGGEFTSAGSCTSGCNSIAKWDGSTWSPLGTGMNNDVYALAISGTDIYAGGNFTSAGSCTSGNGCNRIAKDSIALVFADPTGACGGNSPCYASLQSAINAAGAGGEVRYYGGTYNESVSLNTNATLNFVGSSNVTLHGGLNISAGTFNAPSAYALSLTTGSLTNSGGTFNHNNGTFIFAGSGTQNVSGNFTFNHLTVNSGTTIDVGANTLTVVGTATNAGTIKRLAPAQNITLGTSFTFNDGIGQASAILRQTSGTAMGNTTAQVNANTTTAHACAATTLGGTPVKRYFDVTPTNGANVTADVTLYFFDGASNSEANGNTLANIALFHCESGTWRRLSGTYTTGTSGNYKWVKLNGYPFTTFSPFAISGGPGAPTAVSLSSFRADAPAFDLVAWFAQMLGLAR
ncbi:MAG: hypothetical protein HZC40_20945 [Chloroflexi bacterium]|nr:hypothetical protein [Chloroflexota bacterium]